MKITLFVPTMNEIEGVRAIMPKVKREWVDEILVVDGHSKDGTKEYMESCGYRVLVQEKPGVLNAWWQGLEAATGDVIIPFSPDGNSVPEVIPQLIEKMKEGYDVVIASRYMKGAKSEDDGFITSFGNSFFTGLINLLFGAHYTDALGMYKAFKKELLTSLKLNEHKEEILEILLAIRAAKKKLKVTEIPGDEPPRIGVKESRAWPGLWGKIRGGSLMLRAILKEFIWYRF